MATCPKCGARCQEGAAFCGECGESIPAQSGTVPASPLAEALENPRVQRTIPDEPLAEAVAPPPAAPAGAPRARARQRHLPEGTVVDQKYSILRVLGEGGMGVVYLARDVHTGLDVVVKAVRPELAHRADVRARTLAEGRALARIDHPNVVHLNAVVVEGQSLWLVMQYIDGEPLDKTIKRYAAEGKTMPVVEALGLIRQIALGIGAAHREGMIHRDLKPANVLVRKKDGTAKVTDFGIAKVEGDEKREQTKGILGSLWYMSPEQVTGRRDLDARVDIYALGIVLYQMLTGQVPFDAPSDYDLMKMHAEAPMPLARDRRPDVSPEVDAIIQRCCAKDRANRFSSIDEVVAALDAIRAAPPAASAPLATTTAGARDAKDTHAPDAKTAPGFAATAPGQAKSSGARWGIVAIALAFLGGGAALVLSGVLPLGRTPSHGSTTPQAAPPPKPPTSAPVASSASIASPPRPPIEALVGAWTGNGRALDAVLSAAVLEFRVKTPADFAPQDYVSGEARFVLRATADPTTFSVEDHIRPRPPTGLSFDPASRGTCQEVWTTADDAPLVARYDGNRLTVEFAKIEPTNANFIVEHGVVTSCVGLRKLKASNISMVLERVK